MNSYLMSFSKYKVLKQKKRCIFLSLLHPFPFNGFFYFTESKMIDGIIWSWIEMTLLPILTTFDYFLIHELLIYTCLWASEKDYHTFYILELIFIYYSFNTNMLSHLGIYITHRISTLYKDKCIIAEFKNI